MNHVFFLSIFSIFVVHVYQVSADCERSSYIIGAEDYCWTNKVEVLDRISHAQKKIVNFAKKTIGLDVEETQEPQKCEYYYCIFREMNLQLNPEYDIPCLNRTSNWVKKNVKFDQAITLLERIQSCSEELGKSLGAKQQFLADNVGTLRFVSHSSNFLEQMVVEKDQSRCETASEYMKCLAYIEKNSECPVFQYP